MKFETKLKLATIHQLCDAEDKSTEFMYQLMQEICNVSLDTINNYFMIPSEEKKILFKQINSIVESINKLNI